MIKKEKIKKIKKEKKEKIKKEIKIKKVYKKTRDLSENSEEIYHSSNNCN